MDGKRDGVQETGQERQGRQAEQQQLSFSACFNHVIIIYNNYWRRDA